MDVYNLLPYVNLYLFVASVFWLVLSQHPCGAFVTGAGRPVALLNSLFE